jgi:sRNA-binding carbon storage regulator CsrA
MSLKIDLKVGESVSLGGLATITLMDKSGKLARLDIKAAESVKISHIKAGASQLAREGITVSA